MEIIRSPFVWATGVFKRSLFIRYIFSGGTAAAIDVLLLFILVAYWDIYYLAAATFAMTISFIARFLLQKYVTFEDKDEAHSKKQFWHYSILYVASLLATNALLYFFVETLHFWYVPAQILAILLLACLSFFVYKFLIFKKS